MTPQQKACLDFIAAKRRTSGVSPTFEEIATVLGLKSKSSVHRLVSALERDGHIGRRPYGARAIFILTLDEKLPADIRADASRIASARQMSVAAVIRSALLQYDRSAA